MKKKILTFGSLALILLVLGCQSPAERNVERQAEKNVYVQSPAEAAQTGRLAVGLSNKLSDKQKIQFLDLLDKTEQQISLLKAEEGKLKATLFQSLAEGRYNKPEIEVYKIKIAKIERQKMDIMFDNLKNVKDILGDQTPLTPELLHLYRSETDR